MADAEMVWQARTLLRSARVGTLATASDGAPFAALVTPAAAPDLSLLVLLSGLSPHTRQLRDEPRCAVLVAGPPTDINPQTAPRVTVLGLAAPEPDEALKARWLAVHPYAAMYAGLADFTLWRIRPTGGNFVGGFARAGRLAMADLQPDPLAVAALSAAETDIIGHCNADHPDALAAIASHATGKPPDGWRMVAADLDGCDLACGEFVVRIAWSAPVSEPNGVRAELIRLARAARASSSAE